MYTYVQDGRKQSLLKIVLLQQEKKTPIATSQYFTPALKSYRKHGGLLQLFLPEPR